MKTGMLTAERERYIEQLREDLDSLVAQLRVIPEVEKVFLFGSYAAGRRDLLTDLDLMVVMESPLAFVERNVALARRLKARVALDLLVYTPAEIERMAERPFIRNILANGELLYEK
jgi:predicted nucleotidyltransferase